MNATDACKSDKPFGLRAVQQNCTFPCAIGIRNAASDLGLEIRAGVHTGEIQATPDDVRGVAVHAVARIQAAAGPGQILASPTVVDLLDGSGLVFEDAGLHELKGLAGARQLFRLVS